MLQLFLELELVKLKLVESLVMLKMLVLQLPLKTLPKVVVVMLRAEAV